VRTIDDVCDVEWQRTAAVRVALKECAYDRGLVTVIGPVGVGKTFSVARGAEALSGRIDEVCWVELSATMRGRGLLTAMYPQLAGGPAPKGASERQLIEGLHLVLADEHRLVVVDEAQHIQTQAMGALRGLHSYPTANFGLVLIGTQLLEDRLSPELRSRRTRRVVLERISDAEAPTVLADYHPLFDATEPDVLAEANRRYARGEFRWWAKLLVRADHYHRGGGLSMADIAQLADGL
jgi:type II secretory pathway predicted ATPase ExeA